MFYDPPWWASAPAASGPSPEVAALDERLDTAESSITALDGRLDTAESTLATQGMTVAIYATTLTSHTNSLTALDERLDTAESTLTSQASTLTSLDGRLDDLESGGGGGDLSTRAYSPVDRVTARGPNHFALANFTFGGSWAAWRPISISALRYRWDAAAETFTIKIRDTSGELRTVSASPTGTGIFTATLATPFVPVIGDTFRICIVGSSGISYTSDQADPGLWHPFALDHALVSYSLGLYSSGDTDPTSQSGSVYAIEPVYTLL
jgi:uncharacterized coiled-coil protein SlyX